MPTLIQRIRLGLAGWNRRRAEEDARKRSEFVARQTTWTAPAKAAAELPRTAGGREIDIEGLQVAFLDDSGVLEHFLDLETGEILDFPSTDVATHGEMLRDPRRYRKIPRRSAASDATDRRLFTEALDREDVRLMLRTALFADDAAGEFRRIVARDRGVERAWFLFKNDRAMGAVEEWLRALEANSEFRIQNDE